MNSIKKKYCILWMLFATIAFSSCKEREIYPEIPSIQYLGYFYAYDPDALDSLSGTLLGIKFSYKDGDGDIGLNPGDTFPPYDRQLDAFGNITNPYYYNILIDYLEVKNGLLHPFIIPNTTDTFNASARISSLTPDGKFKAIRGDIEYKFLPPLYIERSDSVVLRIKIYDRALHQSNTIQTPVIILP